jgi:uncharacterized protein (TIGR02266 family)
MEKRERRAHYRGKPRPGRRVEVTVTVAGGGSFRAYTRNIGVGGAFIVTTTPERAGTALTLSLTVPSLPQTLVVKAEVRWNTPGDAYDPPGMGVKFFGLEVEELLALNEYFASLTGREDTQH